MRSNFSTLFGKTMFSKFSNIRTPHRGGTPKIPVRVGYQSQGTAVSTREAQSFRMSSLAVEHPKNLKRTTGRGPSDALNLFLLALVVVIHLPLVTNGVLGRDLLADGALPGLDLLPEPRQLGGDLLRTQLGVLA